MYERRLKISPAEFSKFKQHFKLNRCFYPGCDKKAIKAHSIQENGPLRLISDSVQSQENQVYFLDDDLRHIPEIDAIGSIQEELKKMKHRGIKEASTFAGFCDEHDKEFSDIENQSFTRSERQCFLFTYRAFAYNMHQTSAGFQGTEKVNEMTMDKLSELDEIEKPEGIENSPIEGLEELWASVEQMKSTASKVIKGALSTINDVVKVGLTEMDVVRKQELDNMIRSGDYSKLSYCVRSIDGIFPIASSAIISYLDDNLIIQSDDGIAYSACYTLTVLPDENSYRTHFIIGALDENPNIPIQMERFKKMRTSEFLQTMSNMLIFRGQNTYLSPRLVQKMTPAAIERFIEIRVSRRESNQDLGVENSEINLFDKRFIE
ncbi:MAG: hypothetical protein Crog4KO_24080 [Crocinitomicaceae bacterium]